jgi:hypothetical protein
VRVVCEQPLFGLSGQALGTPSAFDRLFLKAANRVFEYGTHQGYFPTRTVRIGWRIVELLRQYRGRGERLSCCSQVIEKRRQRWTPERFASGS